MGYKFHPDRGFKKKSRHFGVGQGSLGPRGFLSTNNRQCYCRGRAGACVSVGAGEGVGARVSVRVWAKESDVLQGWSRLWRPGRGAGVFQWPARDGETSRRQRQRQAG